MFNVGGGEIVVVLLLALLLLGPEKLPEAARKIGTFLAEVRRVTTGFQEEVRSAIDLGPVATVADLLDTTTPGPRLEGPVEDPSIGTPAGSTPAPGPTSSAGAAFVADLSTDPTPEPAPGTD